jgi:hypothetical protein
MMSGQFWSVIHGAYNPDSLQPLKLTKAQKKLCQEYGVPENEVYYMPGSLTPQIWFRDGLMVDLMGFHEMIWKQMQMKERIQAHIDAIEEFKREGKYIAWFIHMDKKFITPMYLKMYKNIPVEKLYDVFESIWTRAETGFELFTEECLRYTFATRKYSKEWKARMAKFRRDIKKKPEQWITGLDGKQYLKVYHGEKLEEYNPGDQCSWTLQEKTAEFFANRFGTPGEVQERLIQPREALDYLTDRNEAEVLLWPEAWEPLKQRKTK